MEEKTQINENTPVAEMENKNTEPTGTKNTGITENKWFVPGIIIIAILLVSAGIFWAIQSKDIIKDDAKGALIRSGKVVEKYAQLNEEALKLFDMDQIISNMIASEEIWISALQQQGVANPTADQVKEIREMVKNDPKIFANFTNSIKQSFVDAMQGDEVADPQLKTFFQDLIDGKVTEDFKEDNGEAVFTIPGRDEKWHMKKMDGKWKVYKIDFQKTTSSSSSSSSSTTTTSTSSGATSSTSSISTSTTTSASN